MNINILGFGFMTLIGIYFIYVYHSLQVTLGPSTQNPWLVPEQVGKTKTIQSKTGDASLHTEYSRRKAIIYGMSGQQQKIRESRVSAGSTTGAVESYFLSAVATPPGDYCYLSYDG